MTCASGVRRESERSMAKSWNWKASHVRVCLCCAKGNPDQRGGSTCGIKAVRVSCSVDPSRPAYSSSSSSQPPQSRSRGQYWYDGPITREQIIVFFAHPTRPLYFLQIWTYDRVSTVFLLNLYSTQIQMQSFGMIFTKKVSFFYHNVNTHIKASPSTESFSNPYKNNNRAQTPLFSRGQWRSSIFWVSVHLCKTVWSQPIRAYEGFTSDISVVYKYVYRLKRPC